MIFAVGAVLDFGVYVSPYRHGFNSHSIGVILMFVGAVGFVPSLLFWASGRGWYGGRHDTVVDDGRGNFVHREDTFRWSTQVGRPGLRGGQPGLRPVRRVERPMSVS